MTDWFESALLLLT